METTETKSITLHGVALTDWRKIKSYCARVDEVLPKFIIRAALATAMAEDAAAARRYADTKETAI